MNNYEYPPGSDVSWAPWNQINYDRICPECGVDALEMWDEGMFKHKMWVNYKCADCGYIVNNSPY